MSGNARKVALTFCWILSATQAQALEIFGITLFGGGNEEDVAIEVIDPQPYQVAFDVATQDDEIARSLRQSSELWIERQTPASGAAGLIATAQGDYRSLLATLYSLGHYSGAISIRINGTEAASMPLTTQFSGTAMVTVRVDPGPSFVFGRTDFVNPPPRRRAAEAGSGLTAQDRFEPGRPARSDVISAVGDEAVINWRHAGHPKARVGDREVIADHGTRKLDVTVRMDPGPSARFGAVRVAPSETVDEEFIRYMADIPAGERFDPDVIDRAVERLNSLRVFSAVRVSEAEEVAADGTLPLSIETQPRLPRRYGFGGTLSSTEGLGLEAFWLHRNLLGRAERLRFDARIGGIGDKANPENYTYELGTLFTKPGVFEPDTDLLLGATVGQYVYDTYDERKITVRGGLSRRFSDRLLGTVSLEVAYSDVNDDQGNRDFLTFALPVRAEYDRRDDPLDPTRGYYLSGELRPFHETQFTTTGARAEIEGRTYFGFAEGRTVLALRAKYGTVQGGDLDELAPDLLFFTGGGGSVRGFAYRANGLEIGGETVGGRSAIELSAEVRQRISSRIGLAAFADGGIVSASTFPDGDTDMRVGAGLGARFYTGLGPIRLDVATPLDRQKGDPSVAFYVGIGQAF